MSGNTLKIHLAFRLYETQKFISTITCRQIAQLFPPLFFIFPAVGTANSLRNWKMMKYYQLGLQGRSSSNITAVSFRLIAQSLHFKEADEAPRWRCALRPTFKKKRKREIQKKDVGSSSLPSAVGATWAQPGPCDHVVKVSGVAGWPALSVVLAAQSSTTKTGPTVARKKAWKQEVCTPPSQRVGRWIFFKKLSQ